MKKTVGKEIAQRILAVILSVVMAAGLIPASTLMVLAETIDHKDCVTISVVDEEGRPVEGAEVDYTISSIARQTEYKKDKIITDNNGVVEILPKDGYVENDMKVTAKINKADYFESTLPDQESTEDVMITADNQDIPVVLKSKNIRGITVTPAMKNYTGATFDAATITGTREGDKVSFKLDDSDWKELSGDNGMAKISEVGTYLLTVRVERENYNVFETTVCPQITEGIFTIDAEGLTRSYTEGQSYPAIVINSGLQDGDTYTCTVNGVEAPANTIPNIENPGVYSVTLKVDRNNYVSFQKTYTTSINLVEIDGYGAEIYSGVFDGIEHNAVTGVTGNGDGESFQYRMSSGSENVEDDVNFPWSDTMPQVKNAGVYSVQIRVVKGNPADPDYVKATFAPAYVVVDKAEQKVEFIDKEDTLEYSGQEGEPIDYSASVQGCEHDAGYVLPTVVYEVKSTDSSVDVADIAEINEEGKLTVKGAGQIEITASVPEDNAGNYLPQEARMIVNIVDKSNQKLIEFESASVDYIIGTGNDVANLVANRTAAGKNDKGNITYSAKIMEGGSLDEAGMDIGGNGKITLNNISKLASAMEGNQNALTVRVRAEIASYGGIFPKDTASYDVNIAFAEKPENVYKIVDSATNTKAVPNEDGWYQDVVIKPATDGYTIAYSVEDTFSETLNVDDNSDIRQKVYVRNEGTVDNPGTMGIAAPEIIEMKKDAVKPTDVAIEISDESDNIFSKIIDSILYKFLGKEQKVEITFKAKDATSGVNKFDWEYTRSDDASTSILQESSGEVTAAAPDADGYYSASIELPRDVITEDSDQLRGMISVAAVDNAGNESATYTDNGTIIVYDTIAPEIGEVEYKFVEGSVQGIPDNENPVQYYTNKDAQLIVTVKEANFDKDNVVFKIFKDNAEEPVQIDSVNYVYEWADVLADGKMTDEHILTCTIKADAEDHVTDGDYSFSMEYTDASGNAMTRWKSDRTITIDTIVPELQFEYSNGNNKSLTGENEQKVTITVNEHNFRASDISLEMTAENIKGVSVTSEDKINAVRQYLRTDSNWVQDLDDTDIRTLTITSGVGGILKDAIYSMTLHYQDLAFNKIKEDQNENQGVKSGSFIVDHTAPTITNNEENLPYKDAINKAVIKEMLESLELKKAYYYYNSNYENEETKKKAMVSLKFTAIDDVSGVSEFDWTYTREAGASSINLEEAKGKASNIMQDADDKSMFTVEVELPIKTVLELAEESSELRGNITFTATDKYQNVSEEYADNNFIINDTVAPKFGVEYNQSNKANGKLYGNGDFTGTFTITEANFYPEDVVVKLKKGEEEAQEVTINDFTEIATDKWQFTYTIAAPEDHSADGEYVLEVAYTDRSKNPMVAAGELSENGTLSEDGVYTSPVIVIDTITPEVEVAYSNKNVINVLDSREYYDAEQTATIVVDEHNFWYVVKNNETQNDVQYTITAKDASGKEIDLNSVCKLSNWEDDVENPDVHTMTITYPGDANYTFDVEYKDLATNAANYTDTNKAVMDDYHEDKFTVDKTAPANMKVSYSTSILDTVLEALSFGFYNAQMTVTISAEDNVSGVNSFNYSYITAEGVSSVNAQLKNQTLGEANIQYENGRASATTQFKVPKEALNNQNQFNGTVKFTATDRSGKKSAEKADGKRIIVDNITPTSTMEYNAPVQTVDGIAYYDGAVNATLTINEANFYASDVNVTITKDGGTYSVTPSWTNVNTDVHIGTFALTEDGDYHITVNYSDKSGNVMATYTSEQMTVDTEITAPTITVNGEEANGKAFKDDLVPGVSFEDKNFQDYELTLTRTRYNDQNVDVEEQFIAGNVTTTDQGGSGQFNSFDKIAENDGIYTLSVTMRDKAGHSAESSATFTANRYGSVYVYDEYLSDLIEDGGAYVQEVEKDIVVTEYNADRLISGSDNVQISCDGKPVADTDYNVSPVINDQVSVGNSGWYQYEYTISKANFDKDGTYKMSLASEDATGNHPQTENYEDQAILFRVDSTAPEISSITGLEEKIINAQSVDVKYNVYDTIRLESIEVFVNDKAVDKITDFGDDYNNYEGTFKVDEKNSSQTVRLVVTDKAGNVTDTSADDFSPVFAFENKVTISTNAFVRFYANKVLFFGTIGGTVAVAAAAVFILRFRRRKVLDV